MSSIEGWHASVVACVLCVCASLTSCGSESDWIEGTWIGDADAQGMKMEMRFRADGVVLMRVFGGISNSGEVIEPLEWSDWLPRGTWQLRGETYVMDIYGLSSMDGEAETWVIKQTDDGLIISPARLRGILELRFSRSS